MTWKVGQEIFDMHDGMRGIYDKFDVGAGSMVWRGEHVHLWLSAVSRDAGLQYTNKMLMIVAEPGYEDDGYYTAAWSYDGRIGGVVKVKEKS